MRYSLNVEPELEMEIVGICTHLRDYKLCWQINRHLGLELGRVDGDMQSDSGKDKSAHHWYRFTNETTHTEYHLVRNKGTAALLIPEHRQVDYLLIMRENLNINVSDLIRQLRNIENVLTAFRINTDELKNKETLIYLDFEKN
jgi:hypothetical protein